MSSCNQEVLKAGALKGSKDTALLLERRQANNPEENSMEIAI